MEEKEFVWRRDKRTAQQMRPLKCDCSVLTRSDGSARFSVGNTSVLASVYGPADVDSRRGLRFLPIFTTTNTIIFSLHWGLKQNLWIERR